LVYGRTFGFACRKRPDPEYKYRNRTKTQWDERKREYPNRNTGSYSVTIPQFTVQVMDGNDPNRIVRTITPPGGIDKDLWSTETVEPEGYDTTIEIPDPRPWKERFFEGERNYFFIINAQTLDSYTIEFKVPTRYLENSTAESS